jgi:hypothetical protein
MAPFTSLFRFCDDSGLVYYGEAGESSGHTKESLIGRSVPVFRGENPWDVDFALTGDQRKVVEVPAINSTTTGCVVTRYM